MNKHASFLLGALLVCAIMVMAEPQASTSGQPVTLKDAYQRALTVSETLQITDQEIEQIRAQYLRGVGAVLPDLRWKWSQLWQDTSGVSSGNSDGATSTSLRKVRPESYFQLDQPLFHGFREFNAVRGFKAARKATEFYRQQAALDLLNDVADVFFTALDLQNEAEVLNSQRQLTQERIQELNRRVRLGRSRDSEILSAEVELASLDAQIDNAKQSLGTARQTLWFLTRITPDTALIETTALPELPERQGTLDRAFQRPDLLAAEQTLRQQEFRLKYAKGNYWPGLDFIGRYYTNRVGFTSEVDWDAELQLDVPIFQGFTAHSGVKEAKAEFLIAQLERARLERQVRQLAETAFQDLGYSLARTRSYERAVALAEKNYRTQQEEYRLGLINNLQVFDVLKILQDLKLQKLRAEASTRINAIRLRVATGQGL